MALVRKRTAGSAPGHTWDHDGQTLEVPDGLAFELIALPAGDFELASDFGDGRSAEEVQAAADAAGESQVGTVEARDDGQVGLGHVRPVEQLSDRPEAARPETSHMPEVPEVPESELTGIVDHAADDTEAEDIEDDGAVAAEKPKRGRRPRTPIEE